MAIKVERGGTKPKFEPYSITITVDTYLSHRALKYMAMCYCAIPSAIQSKARNSTCDEYAKNSISIGGAIKEFLKALKREIPDRWND